MEKGDAAPPASSSLQSQPIPEIKKGESIDSCAASLLEKMTMEEKIQMISGTEELAIPGVERLGIPPVWMTDATSGVRCFGKATVFPANISMAASWNRKLIQRAGAVIGEEARAKGVSILLGPGMNISRVPINGRNFEYMGEDPFLTGEMAFSYVEGVQSKGVMTTLKHFACNNSEYDRHKSNSVLSEKTLREIYLPAFRRALHQGPLDSAASRSTRRLSGSLGIMTSYNQINGQYASEHRHLIQDVLRKDWEFDGLVVSDWNSLYHTSTPMACGVDIEMPKPRWFSHERVMKALNKGSISIDMLDTKVLQILKISLYMGFYAHGAGKSKFSCCIPQHKETAREIAGEGVVLLKNENMLPLPIKPQKRKNSSKTYTIVVTGRCALETPTGGGGSSYMNRENWGYDEIPIERDILLSLQNLVKEQTGKTEPLKDYDSPEVEIIATYVPGLRRKGKHVLEEKDKASIAAADAVLAAVGFDYVYESESYDRMYDLPEEEGDFIREISSINSETAVILHGGGDMETSSWIDGVKAVLFAGYLGQHAGAVIADILFGRINPSGKLPFTMARRLSDFASMKGYPKKFWRMSLLRVLAGQGNPWLRRCKDLKYHEGNLVGYRQFEADALEPHFPFGHGLSYTAFSYADAELNGKILPLEHADAAAESAATDVSEENSKLQLSHRLNISLKLTLSNTGKTAGAETVQVYAACQEGESERNGFSLCGFEKFALAAGEERVVVLMLDAEVLAAFFSADDPQLEVSEKGYAKGDPKSFDEGFDKVRFLKRAEAVQILIGSSSRDIRIQQKLSTAFVN